MIRHRLRRHDLSTSLRRTALAALFASAGAAAAQPVLYVDADAPPGGDGLAWASALDDLQAALAAADPGTEIWVVAGTYHPGAPGEVDATFALPDRVALYGGFAGGEVARDQRDWTAHPTVLSGDLGADDVYGSPVWYQGWTINTPNSAHVVTANGVGVETILDGFTVTAGYATFDFGAGMRVIGGAPTIRNTIFTRNLAGFASGGGLHVDGGSPTMRDCAFIENYVHLGKGAGLLVAGASAVTVSDTLFLRNRAVGGGSTEAAGGGLASYSTLPVTVRRCRFEDNEAVDFYAQGDPITRGGGIHSFADGLRVEGSEFVGNFAHAGAGIYTWGETTVVDSLFFDNTVVAYPSAGGVDVGGYGAGIASGSAQADTTTLVGSVFAGNHAGEAAGVWTGWNHQTVILGSILWGNSATGEGLSIRRRQLEGASEIHSSCVEGLFETVPGEDPPAPEDYPGSIDADPLFVGFATGDLRLAAGSPAIDAGDNSVFPPGTWLDLDGGLRFVDDPAAPDTGTGDPPLADLGPYERGGVAALVFADDFESGAPSAWSAVP